MDTKIVHCFRCYIEINQLIHRIVIRDIDGKDKYSRVNFGTILAKLRDIDGLEEVNLRTHRFLILDQNTRRLLPIKNRNFLIKSGYKIMVCSKTTLSKPLTNLPESVVRSAGDSGKIRETTTKRCSSPPNSWSHFQRKEQTVRGNTFVLKMALIDSIRDIVKNNQRFNWKRISEVMKLKGFPFMDYRKEFYSIIQMLIKRHRDNSFSENKIDDQTLHIWRRIESMCLKKVLSSEVFKEIEHLKNASVVKQTVDWLLIQTSKSWMGTDHRLNSQLVSDNKKEPPKNKLENNSVSPIRPKGNGLVFDRKLVEVIAKLQINEEKFFDWPTIRKELIADTAIPDFGEQYLKYRFQQIIKKYIRVLSQCDSDSDANRLWPLFRQFSELDLKPFCDHIIHQNIKSLKERFSTSLDTFSIGSQHSFK